MQVQWLFPSKQSGLGIDSPSSPFSEQGKKSKCKKAKKKLIERQFKFKYFRYRK